MPDNENNSTFITEENSGSSSLNPEAHYAAFSNPVPPVQEKKNRTWVKVTAIVLAFLLVLAGAGLGGKAIYDKVASSIETEENGSPVAKLVGIFGRKDVEGEADSEEPSVADNPAAESAVQEQIEGGILVGQREDSKIDVNLIDTSKQLTTAEVYAINVNSTVGITVGITYNYWGYTSNSAASGSGFIVSSDGYIVTNYHVIEGANSITVTMYDDTSYEATVASYDKSNDIAILKVDAEDLVPVVLGDSDNMNVGDTVIAIGNPLGELTFSLTQGVISALGREVTLEAGLVMNLIQTDCSINAGNSGGALFNLYGEVIGITNAKYSSSGMSETSIDNIGFAIPMNTVINIIEQTVENGSYSKPFIGVTVSELGDSYQAYGVPAGLAVSKVTEDGPAAQAGVLANDIITAVNGKEISTVDELRAIITELGIGNEITLSIYRQGETMELMVIIGEDDQKEEASSEAESQQNQNGFPFDFGNGNGYGYGNGNGYGYGNGGSNDDDYYGGLDDFADIFGDLFGSGSDGNGSGNGIWDYFFG